MKDYTEIINDLISKNERLKYENHELKERIEAIRESLEKAIMEFDGDCK